MITPRTSMIRCFLRESEPTYIKANIGVLSVNGKTSGLTILSDTSRASMKNYSMHGLPIQ
jgi:hypothetical protein